MIYQVSLFGKVGVHGYNQVKKHKTNVTLHSRFCEWVYFVTGETHYSFGGNSPYATVMRKKEPGINHQFDVWHFVKNKEKDNKCKSESIL